MTAGATDAMDAAPRADLPDGRPGTALIVLCIALAAWGLSNMDQSFFGYAIPGVMKTFGFGLPAVGLMISASFLVSIVIAPAAGAVTDIYGAKWTLPFCLALSAAFVGLQGLANAGWLFTFLRVAGYGFSGALSPITNALVSSAAPPRHRPLAIAVLQCGYPLGWFAASLIAAPLLPTVGWRGVFAAAFVVVPAAAGFVFLIPRAPRPAQRQAGAGRRLLLGPILELFSAPYGRRTIQIGLAFLLYGGAAGGTSFYLPSFFQEERHYTAAAAARLIGLSYGVGVIGYIGSALVSQRLLSRRATVALWLSAGAVSFAALLWTSLGPGVDFVLFAATAIFLFGSSAILIVYLLELFPERLRATAAAISGTSAIGLGFVIFPALIAALAGPLGWGRAMSVTALPATALALALMVFLPRGVSAAHVRDEDGKSGAR